MRTETGRQAADITRENSRISQFCERA
jgi:hypothetical protein